MVNNVVRDTRNRWPFPVKSPDVWTCRKKLVVQRLAHIPFQGHAHSTTWENLIPEVITDLKNDKCIFDGLKRRKASE